MNELLNILAGLPVEAKAFFALIAGAGASALRNKSVPIGDSIRHLITALVLGYLVFAIATAYREIPEKAHVAASGFVGIFADTLWVLVDKLKEWLQSSGFFKMIIRNILKQIDKDEPVN